MTTCIVFNSNYKIKHIDDNKINVWELKDASASTVGIQGHTQFRIDLRKSTSIRDKFIIDADRGHGIGIEEGPLKYYFSSVVIGIGSKHTHIMTLIITDYPDNLKG